MEKRKKTKFIIVALILFFAFTERIHAKEWYDQSLGSTIDVIKEESGMTSQIRILGVKYNGDQVTINLSKELLSYGGGTYTEYIIGTRLMEWAFTHTKARVMSLQVEGEIGVFPEGSDYSTCTKENYEAYYKIP